MLDLVYIGAGIAFFALAIFYVAAANGCEAAMTLDLWLGALVTVGILAYLVFALIRPELF